MAQIKRETAIICSVKDLLDGGFVKTEGWTPSYFVTSAGNISRANLMGVVVSNDSEGLFVDDGTGRILLRSFENVIPEIEIGSLIMIIGRPRVFNEQKYVVPEIIRKVSPAWAEFRRIQLERVIRTRADFKPEEKRTPVKEEVSKQNPFQKIVEFIKDLDRGEGAELEEVIKRSGLSGAEDTINRLIEEGEIFEIKPGRLKILE
jgi:RPA family protein